MVAAAIAPPVHCFPVTGGPCSGKTTAMSYLQRNQASLFEGHSLLVVPEAATLYHKLGARLPFGTPASSCGQYSSEERNLLWELLLNELKRTLEVQCINEALEAGCPSIVCCDRGIVDSRAYLSSDEEYERMLSLGGWSASAVSARYDHVFHLAMCPQEAYQSENNAARRETYGEALALDQLTWDAWATHVPHAHTRVEGEDEGIDSKIAALADAMRRVVASAPVPSPKRPGWSMQVEAVVALADTVAIAPDLSRVAPVASAVVRRVRTIDERVGRAGQQGGARRGAAASRRGRVSAGRAMRAVRDGTFLWEDVLPRSGEPASSVLGKLVW